jgi:lipid-binding SYLF domain-containing protein
MKRRSVLASIGVCMALSVSCAFAADKAKDQAEVRKATTSALDKFYKAQPSLKTEVEKAPGYAVFTTYGLSFLVGGAGGSGLAHDNKANKDTYMNMAQASAGVQAGIQESELLIVFKNQKAMEDFVNKGWEFGAGGAVGAGAAGKTVGGGGGEQFVNDALFYSYTKKGIEAGVGFAGTKFWKSKELN